jgi:5-methylcytosine-specific restriction protein A
MAIARSHQADGSKTVSRKLPEWIGKTENAAIPPRVRVRVFERHHGICHISGRRIRAGEVWDLDHIVALANGGAHRESNLAPALRGKHREKTAADLAEKSRVARKRAKFLGVAPKRQKIQSRGFDKAPPQRTASRPISRHST